MHKFVDRRGVCWPVDDAAKAVRSELQVDFELHVDDRHLRIRVKKNTLHSFLEIFPNKRGDRGYGRSCQENASGT